MAEQYVKEEQSLKKKQSLEKKQNLKKEQQQKLARELLQLTKGSLLMHFRFLAPAVSGIQLEEKEDVRFACDGKRLYYSPKAILQYYKNEKTYVNRLYFHCMLHCMLQHMYARETYQGIYWNLACDIAVEAVLLDLNKPFLASYRDGGQRAVLEQLREQIPAMTAEVIYHHFMKQPPAQRDLEAMIRIFEVDDHAGWSAGARREKELDEDSQEESKERSDLENDAQKKQWERICRRALVELKDFEKHSDQELDALIQNLTAVTRTRYDYRHFLERFFSWQETMQINTEEFDYIFYTYGLKLYKNVPLIEPLEYKEDKRIREFAIVIDTSASVKGEIVQRFLQHTYNILMQKEHFFSRINLHLIQCDSKVQEAVRITSPEQIQDYIDHLEIKGLGRTDFRPAFAYVEQLAADGELKHLSGMLYFTDGEGIYPRKKPDFETAFVFLENYVKEPQVPSWAIRIILSEEELSDE